MKSKLGPRRSRRHRSHIMIRLKHCLMATAGLVHLVTAVARLNALDAGGKSMSAARRRPCALQP